ncbi:MAG: phospho-sugar mutase, partial [Pseudomonadota bacterium]
MNRSALSQAMENWLQRDPDPTTRQELLELQSNEQFDDLENRFLKRLEFGTAGLRGLVGVGPGRMNRLVVRETTAGLAEYLLETQTDVETRGVVITFDARPDSRQFAIDAAGILLAQGIKVYLTKDPQPTPVGAFGVVNLGAAAGIVVTASHNPPEYNGYKVYWGNGAQIIPPHDAGIARCIDNAATQPLRFVDLTTTDDHDELVWLGADFVKRYSESVHQMLPSTTSKDRLRVAYTALHGVGAQLAVSVLESSGLCNVHPVASQVQPDGTFPTVNFPNPEEPGAMDAVIALAKEKEAELAVANDPDADRLAVAVRCEDGTYKQLSGDQVGILLGNFVLSQSRNKQPIVCTTIVSSRLLRGIAEAKGARYCETLTGFKWLSNTALDLENETREFLFAYEEALGYCIGRAVRDKDGISALLAFVQMASELARKGKTVLDQLDEIYQQYGVYVTQQVSIATNPEQASPAVALRRDPPAQIGGITADDADPCIRIPNIRKVRLADRKQQLIVVTA